MVWLNGREKNHFVFVVSPVETDSGLLSAYRFWSALTDNQVWYVTAGAPYADRIRSGDQVLFCLKSASGGGGFVAHGLCSGPVAPLNDEDRAFMSRLGITTRFTGRVPLLLVIYWPAAVPVEAVAESLRSLGSDGEDFCRGEIVPIAGADFDLIVAQSAAE